MANTRKAKGKDLIDQILDQIDPHGMTQDEVLGQEGLLKQLTGKLRSRIMNAEMDEHLGYEKNSNAGGSPLVRGRKWIQRKDRPDRESECGNTGTARP